MFEYALFGVALVAAEEFVATIPGEHDLDTVFARHARTKVGRCRRRVAEGLVVERRDEWHCRDDVVRRDVVLVRPRPEMPCGDAGEFELVEALRLEADGEGVRGPFGNAAEHAADGRAIGAARQKCAGGSLWVDLALDRLPGEREKALAQRGLVRRCGGVIRQLPVMAPAGFAALEHQALGGEQFLDPVEDGIGTGHHVAVEILVDRLAAEARSHLRMTGDGAGAGGEREGVARAGEAKAFRAAAVDCEQHACAALVHQHQRKIAPQGFKKRVSRLAIGGEYGRRVAFAPRACLERGVCPSRTTEHGSDAP